MKRFLMLCLFMSLFTAFKCDNEPLEGEFVSQENVLCEIAIANVMNAQLAFENASDINFESLCIAYKSAIQEQISVCGDPEGLLQTQLEAIGNCNEDTEPDPEPDDTFPITWIMTGWIGEEPIDLNNDGVSSTNYLDEINCYTNETIVLNEDNTAVITSTSFADFEFVIQIGTTDSYEYTVTCIEEIEVINSNWSQTNNTLVIEDSAVISEWTLNGGQMFAFVPNGFIAFSSDNVEVTITEDITIIYTRL